MKKYDTSPPQERVGYLDTIRFLAALWVFTTHFIAVYSYESFRWWIDMPSSLFLRGVSGKLAVTVFCVVSGWLAYKNLYSQLADAGCARGFAARQGNFSRES